MSQQPLKVAFINLPHRKAIVRRYMCSYYSPLFHFPPYDLLQLATCAREWNGAEVCFLDAIAEGCDEEGMHAFLARQRPDIVVALTGIESVSADLGCMDRIKQAFPNITAVVFGHFPTIFPELVLQKTSLDLILRNEPEESFSAYLAARSEGGDATAIPGIAGRDATGRIFVNPERRIADLDRLPFADYSLVNIRKYEEPWLGGPWGALVTARGCPFSCEFCIRTFGQTLVAKKPETVVAEMKSMLRAGIRVIRFVDDTFTLSKGRVIEICQGILRERLSVPWACLANVNTLDGEMLHWMKEAGCVRVLVGIESYSQKILSCLGKKIDPGKTNAALQLIHDAGMEAVGFVIVGAPEETEADFQETLKGVMRAPMDLMIASIFVPYAGTSSFDRFKNDVIFNLIPYEFRFKDESIGRNALKRERRLYWHFYLRPAVLLRHLPRIARFPYHFLRYFLMLLWFAVAKRKDDDRADLF